jgi:hypothetical protein
MPAQDAFEIEKIAQVTKSYPRSLREACAVCSAIADVELSLRWDKGRTSG